MHASETSNDAAPAMQMPSISAAFPSSRQRFRAKTAYFLKSFFFFLGERKKHASPDRADLKLVITAVRLLMRRASVPASPQHTPEKTKNKTTVM